MEKNAKIYVAGHTGLVGSAIVRNLKRNGYSNLVYKSFDELDLTIQANVEHFFAREKPEYVFLAAAKVGGILANNTFPADFIQINLAIQNNLIHFAWKYNVKRLLFLGSSCIYPKVCPQPMKEEYLLTGSLEPTNEPYAIAKIAGLKMCEAYNRQFQTQFVAVMPTNLFGPGDNFDLENSHVLPALIRKFHEATENKRNEVQVWGSGKPKREFLYVDDMADGCVFIMNLPDNVVRENFLSYPNPCFANLGVGKDLTIGELAEKIAETIGFKGKIVFDATKPDGTKQKLLDVSKIESLGWKAKTSLSEGLLNTYAWYLKEIAKKTL
jgi:GDP-L-fucose synthase